MNGNNIKISIITTVFNIESYIEQCINSIINQTYRNFELEMLEMFKKQDADEYTIPVSSSPIHYALAGYTNYSYGGVSGLALNATNNGAKNYFHDLKNIVGDSFVSYEDYTTPKKHCSMYLQS